ncbi:hypothetical protein M446_4299 [Methylobacterium sp. 4-46]|nr:hypothetical protein M446_4299 [Methylobacterium sp. 4-46]
MGVRSESEVRQRFGRADLREIPFPERGSHRSARTVLPLWAFLGCRSGPGRGSPEQAASLMLWSEQVRVALGQGRGFGREVQRLHAEASNALAAEARIGCVPSDSIRLSTCREAQRGLLVQLGGEKKRGISLADWDLVSHGN